MISSPSDPSRERIVLRCLGHACLVSEGEQGHVTTILPLGKPLGLLIYLTLAPDRSASRDRLADLLWGDQERANARQSVRRALSFLRAHIGPWVVAADECSCTASSELRSDTEDFAAAIANGDLAGALRTYRGDFLADFASPGARQFEVWADVERAYFRSQAVRVAECVCRGALDSGRFADARVASARLRAIDPNCELGWRLTLEALIAAGDRVGAIAEAAKFETWLEAEEREPEQASRAAIRGAYKIASPPAVEGVAASELVPELVGREKAFRTILAAWERAFGGRAEYVLIAGGAGLGKTRLVESIAQRLRSLRRRTLVVRAFSGERAIPGAFAGALVHELAVLPGASGVSAHVVPSLSDLDPRVSEHFAVPASTSSRMSRESSMSARSAAIRELITAVCDESALALIIDDAHWMDAESVQLLAGALARARDPRLLLVVTSRTLPTGLDIEDRATRLYLEPLSAMEIGALVASLGSLPTDADWPIRLVSKIAEASRGIPLLALAALEHLVAEGVLVLDQAAWVAPAESRLHERLLALDPLAGRLRALPPAAFRLVLAYAVAGRPLPETVGHSVATALCTSPADTSQELERTGYLRHTTTGVEVSHDATAETAIQLASPEMVAEVSRVIGLAFAESGNPALVEHALRHLTSSRDLDAIVPALTTVAKDRPRAFKSNPSEFVARQLGLAPSDALVRAALSRLPLGLRLTRHRRRVFAGLVLVGACLGGTVAAARMHYAEAEAPSIEVVLPSDDKYDRVARVGLDRDAWSASAPISLSFDETRIDSIDGPDRGALVLPGQEMWATEIQSSDSGGADVAIVDHTHGMRRLTWSHADETPQAWSPDGSRLAIATSAFDPDGYRTVGLLDVRTGTVRRVGTLDPMVEQVVWSPDGTRLAYTGLRVADRAATLCIAAAEGATANCHVFGVASLGAVGWLSDDELLLRIGRPGSLGVYDTESGRVSAWPIDSVTEADLSPDGAWVLFSQLHTGILEWYLAPADAPGEKRMLAANRRLPLNVTPRWSGRFLPREYLDRVAIRAASDTADVGTAFHLSASGFTNLGHSVPVHAQVWTSSNPAIARVDSAGELIPLAPGVVTIELSAGGWRRAKRTFIVRREIASVILREDWHDPFAARWVPFGVPLPVIDRDSELGPSFDNNGDGWYFSGAYLAKEVYSGHGIAVDATIRVPITRTRDQYLDIDILSLHGLARLQARWDRRTGYIPYRLVESGGECHFSYPAGQTYDNVRRAGPMGRLTVEPGESLPALARGVRRTVRVQIFPDGVCGVALEGEKPWVSATPRAPGDSAIVILQGNSVGTHMRVGPLTIWRGIPAGVVWSRGDHRR